MRIVDVAGGQVADLFALSTDDPSEHLSAQHTRAILSRLFPALGDDFFTNRRRPILHLERDDSPGAHDMLIAACDPERYRLLGVRDEHASCQANFFDAVAAAGFPVPTFCPQPVNLFMAIPIGADGRLDWQPAPTAAGDSVTLRAAIDCVIVVSACPQDLVPINHLDPGPLRLEIGN